MKYSTWFDKGFLPLSVVYKNYQSQFCADNSSFLHIAIEKDGGYIYVYKMLVSSDSRCFELTYALSERIIKSILWIVGGYKIYLCGDNRLIDRLLKDFSLSGKRAFDVDFMSKVYERKFEAVKCDLSDFPKQNLILYNVGGNYSGYRVGFDAGGSDLKVSAVIDGKVVFSKEIVWNPKLSSNYMYQYSQIESAIRQAVQHMPRLDAIGVSSAGIYVDNKIKVSSLFLKIPEHDFDKHVKNMYLDIAKSFGVPITVANDGDVTALSGAIGLNDGKVLGIAMGTSEAGGYINENRLLTGMLSELAFVPVDFSKYAAIDEWSKDFGCGVKYFSQDAVIKLAENSGFVFENGLSPKEKLETVQDMLYSSDTEEVSVAKKIFEDIGTYLGYTIPWYAEFYRIKHLLVLGRVTSGKAGDIIIKRAKMILKDEFKEFADLNLVLPDEKNKRMGQSIAAASL